MPTDRDVAVVFTARETAELVTLAARRQAAATRRDRKGEVSLVGAPWRRQTDIAAQEILHHVFFDYVVLRSGWEWELPLHEEEFRENSTFQTYSRRAEVTGAGEGEHGRAVHGRSAARMPARVPDLMLQRTEKLAVVFDRTDV
jgi:hypothetical protein